jgi:hypothetical protein
MTKKEEQEVMEIESLREPMSVGKIFAESGLFPDIKSQAQAAVKIMAGRELGLTPFQSMKSLYLVNGKLGMMADVMASLLKKSDKYDYTVDKLDNEECTISFYYKDKERTKIGESSFSFKDAAKAGLVNKDVWKSYPRNLLFARALSNGVRWHCPDVGCGYTVEEIENIYDVERPKETITIESDGTVRKEDNGEAKLS